jgi:hypothetical protein
MFSRPRDWSMRSSCGGVSRHPRSLQELLLKSKVKNLVTDLCCLWMVRALHDVSEKPPTSSILQIRIVPCPIRQVGVRSIQDRLYHTLAECPRGCVRPSSLLRVKIVFAIRRNTHRRESVLLVNYLVYGLGKTYRSHAVHHHVHHRTHRGLTIPSGFLPGHQGYVVQVVGVVGHIGHLSQVNKTCPQENSTLH